MPVSLSIKRAINLTKNALLKAGYEVEEFDISPEDWRAATDFFMGMVANGNAPLMIEDFAKEGEAFMKPLENNKMIL